MERIKDDFLDKLEEVVTLKNKLVLEIGCGDGTRSVDISRCCQRLVGVEPDSILVKKAKERGIPNATFSIGGASKLDFEDKTFDITLFTLSFHHVPVNEMRLAIDEAVRVTKDSGFIIFLEPSEVGSFFDAELEFDACDGDERKEKGEAYKIMLNHDKLKLVEEINDETVFKFDSVEDFITTMSPKKNQDKVNQFLRDNDFILRAGRRINVFSIK